MNTTSYLEFGNRKAKFFNTMTTPIIIPTLSVIILLFFTAFSELHGEYKTQTFWIYFIFSLLVPAILITLYRKYNGWTISEVEERERRNIPYTIAIVCYLICYYLLLRYGIYYHLILPVITALFILVPCSFINQRWNISTHCAALGGATGLLFGYALRHFFFNPIWMLCFIILLSGIVGTSQITLQKHTLTQTLAGYLLGIIASILSLVII